MRLVAVVIHLTDLHLFVHEDGSQRSAKEREWGLELMDRAMRKLRLSDLAGGFDFADGIGIETLRSYVPEVAANEKALAGPGVPVIVAQTGDVEAFGGLDPAAFAGFRFLREVVYGALHDAGVDHICDLYGNHDVWPGTFPGLRSGGAHRHGPARLAAAGVVPVPRPALEIVPGGFATPVELLAVNSVRTEGAFDVVQGGIFAQGELSCYLPDTSLPHSGGSDVFAELAQLPAPRGLRVALMHHPAHLFAPGLAEAFTTGHLAQRNQVCRALEASGCQLVIAGHRHRLDPPARAKLRATDGRQPPLSKAGQLVSETPTVGNGDRSFSVYRISLDDKDATLSVERVRHAVGYRGQTTQTDRRALSDIPFP